jgi:MFS family permease
VTIIVQFLIFPPVAKLFGTLNLLRIILAFQPIFYIIIPYTALIQNPIIAQVTFIILWTVRSGLVIMAFPCSIILVTNSTASMRVLGTVNGIATATNAIGRAFGPTVSGSLFTWGVHNDRIVAPFMFLAVLSLFNLAPLLWAVEGDGFGDDKVDTVAEDYEAQEFAHGEDQEAVRLEQYKTPEKE